MKAKVSEHALFRYLERTGRLDREALEQEILTPAVEAACRCGATACKVNGITFVIKNHTIVTVLDNDRPGNISRDPDMLKRVAAL